MMVDANVQSLTSSKTAVRQPSCFGMSVELEKMVREFTAMRIIVKISAFRLWLYFKGTVAL